MIDQGLLDILACPETKQKLTLLQGETVDKINELIASGSLQTRSQKKVEQKIDAALVRDDGKVCYPVRDDIPVMLIDEAIELASF